jgi:hypothetical protein
MKLFLHSISQCLNELSLFFTGGVMARVSGYHPCVWFDVHGWTEGDVYEFVQLIKADEHFYESCSFTERYPSYFHFNYPRRLLCVRYHLGRWTKTRAERYSRVTLSSGDRGVTVYEVVPKLLFLFENPGVSLHSWVDLKLDGSVFHWTPGSLQPVEDPTLDYRWGVIRLGTDGNVVIVRDTGYSAEFSAMAIRKGDLGRWIASSGLDTLISYDDVVPSTFVELHERGVNFSSYGKDNSYQDRTGATRLQVTGRNCLDLRRNQVMKAFVSPKLEGFFLRDVVDHESFHPQPAEHPTTLREEAECIYRVVLHSRQLEQGAAISRIAHVNLDVTFHSGQQARIFNIMQESAFHNNFVIDRTALRIPLAVSSTYDDFPDPDISFIREGHLADEKERKNKRQKAESAAKKQYTGGFVHDPVPGYYPEGVWINDFESLYPNIIIAHRLCYASIVQASVATVARSLGLTEKDRLTLDELKQLGLEIKYVTINEHRSVGIVQSFRGVPQVTFADKAIAKLLALRKKTKALMKTAATPAIRDNLDSQQLAMKASANAGYGFWGAPDDKQIFNYLSLAAVVCSIGRFLNKTCAKYVHEHYGAKIVYGDSVMGTTALLLRRHGRITVRSIENMWAESGGAESANSEKQYLDCEGWESWTERGWTRVSRIMRHRTEKQIVRVVTHTGCVDVTEDHSLVRADGTEVTPGSLCLGDQLLHSFPTEWPEAPCAVTVEEAEVMGFFMGDGSCGVYHYEAGDKHSWALNSNNTSIMTHLRELCLKSYPQFQDFVIMDTLASSGVYKLSPRGGNYGAVRDLTTLYASSLYDRSRNKVVPDCILSAPTAIRAAFWKGYYMADGDTNSLARCDAKHEVSALSLYTLMTSLGLCCSVNTRSDKPDVYRVTGTAGKQRRDPLAIKKLTPLGPCNGFVYDLTTENHHFHAGVGQLIVHNTDSIMFTAPGLEWVVANRICDEMTALFPKPIKIVVEGVLDNALFIRASDKTGTLYSGGVQKSYIGLLRTGPEDDPRIKMQGVTGKRRDRCPAVRNLAATIYEHIVHGRTELVLPEVYRVLEAFALHTVPLDALTVTCQLAEEYANEGLQVPRLAQRIGERTGHPVTPGSRVPFVFVKNKDRIEDPKYIVEYNSRAPPEKRIRVDWSYYIDTQLTGVVIPMLQEFRESLTRFLADYPIYSLRARGERVALPSL